MSTGVCDSPAASLAVSPRDAVKVYRWIAHCGGVAVWGCQDLSDPGRTWYTPARLTDGTLSSPPHWSASRTPLRIVTDHSAVEVVEHREVRRLKIAVRHGYGLGLVLTDASSKRLERGLAQADKGATYHFEGNEAVVMAEVSRTPLSTWLEAHPDAKAV
jgi:hypothetical protein